MHAPPRRPEKQKQLKWRKSDAKVAPRGRPQSDSKMTEKWLFQAFWVIFESLWGRSLKVSFESLFRQFACFWFSGLLGGHALHNSNVACQVFMMTKLELISQNCNFNYSTQIPSELWLQKFMLGEQLPPDYVIIIFLQYRIGFDFFFFFRLCNFLRCCKAYLVDIALHYIIVFELIYRLCNSCLQRQPSKSWKT